MGHVFLLATQEPSHRDLLAALQNCKSIGLARALAAARDFAAALMTDNAVIKLVAGAKLRVDKP